ncbi:hypothetical protein EDD18DRAFT_1435120 [Armillaria luteobubalina]|uniref:Heterokaryon incompatibility domain-containing protein n=1 Tax=Armillaria luteobubalina TaxID=153913 RepID=A0AA39QEM8_9AGAR|nr:hypothetical protein EDD18DRAFT_1435120 [Armillaria luteobubalina]
MKSRMKTGMSTRIKRARMKRARAKKRARARRARMRVRMQEPDWEIHKPAEYPEVTISAFTEMGREELSIVVPLQRAYTGRKPVITSCLADTPCATLGVQDLLDQLNNTLRTSYSLDNKFLSSLLEDCIKNGYDFGMAYSRLRQIWYINDWSTVQDVLWRWRNEDWEDNRVVPYWIMDINLTDGYFIKHKWPEPISHAWVDEKDHTAVWTLINGYKWPVPIPRDADLNLIHIEMLNLGLEYAWLDVLCLRQEGGPREDLQTEEWKLDVPTIGAVYRYQNVTCLDATGGWEKEGDCQGHTRWTTAGPV